MNDLLAQTPAATLLREADFESLRAQFSDLPDMAQC